MQGDDELRDLYREVLLDYFRSTSRKGKLPDADFHSHGVNPVCGDEVELTLRRKGGRIEAVRYAGHGCVISQSSTAILAESIEGRTAEEAQGLARDFKAMMLDGRPAGDLPEALEEAKALEGVRKYPVRIKCALLAWNTLLEGFRTSPNGKAGAEYQET